MGKKDPRVDAYIKNSADFAKPILIHLRKLVHSACPDCEETMKWSFPHFDYKGMLCSMASFKQHCAFGFWKGALVFGSTEAAKAKNEAAMGHFGRITSLGDLPSDKSITALIKKAVKLNDDGVKLPAKAKPKTTKPVVVPDYLLAALRRDKAALAAFNDFSASHKREYVEWIVEAKSEATRERRIEQAIEWIREGKSRNWKYEKK